MKKCSFKLRILLIFILTSLSFIPGFINNVFSQEAFHEGESTGFVIQIKENLIENLNGEFSATFQGTPVKDVFRIFAMQSGLNIMVSPVISANITANFNKVGIKDAFLAILSANNLYYLVQGSIVKILTAREYRNELLRQYIITKTYDASIIDIKNLVAVLKPMLSPGVGNFSIDSQSSKIIVTDIKDNFERLDKLFEEISTLPKLVEIETKILEIDLEDGNEIGINWSALNIGNAVDLKFIFPSASGITSDEKVSISGKQTFGAINVDALIEAIAKKNKTHLLSQPRILAINREEATIHIGSRVPYVKSVINNTTTAQQTSQIEFIDVGIKIIVTPLITPDEEVKMNIKAEMSSYTIDYVTSTEKAPFITTTEISCEPIAKTEQTIIIGGLIKGENTKQKKMVPFLGDIPLLGGLFTHTVDTITRSEMVIFITPKVLKEGRSNISFKSAASGEILMDAGLSNQIPDNRYQYKTSFKFN